MKFKLESRLLEEISITSDYADDTTLMAESEEELKSLLMKVKEESEKVGFDPEGWYGEGGGRRVQDGLSALLSSFIILRNLFFSM